MSYRRILFFFFLLGALASAATPAPPSASIEKLRVLTAPGVAHSDAKDWDNSLQISGDSLVLQCATCAPRQSITLARSEIADLRYGQNAYHHWVTGIVTGLLTPIGGIIIAVMPHHQHFYSIDLKNGKVLGFQADKSDYKQTAGLLNNFTGLPIRVTSKDAHFLNGSGFKSCPRTEKTPPQRRRLNLRPCPHPPAPPEKPSALRLCAGATISSPGAAPASARHQRCSALRISPR